MCPALAEGINIYAKYNKLRRTSGDSCMPQRSRLQPLLDLIVRETRLLIFLPGEGGDSHK